MILFITTGNCRVIVVDDLHRHGNSADAVATPRLKTYERNGSATDQLTDLFGEYERDGLTKEDILKVLEEVRDTPSSVQNRTSPIRNEWMTENRNANPFDRLLTGNERRSARYPEKNDLLENDRQEKIFSRQRPTENINYGINRYPPLDYTSPELRSDYTSPVRTAYPQLKNSKKPPQPNQKFTKRLYVPQFLTETNAYRHFSDDFQLKESQSTSPSSNETENFLNPNLNGNLRKKQSKINSLQNSLRLKENGLNKLQKRLEEQESLKKKNNDLLKNLQKNIERNEKELKQKVASLKLLNNEINEKQKVLNGLQYDFNKKQKEKELIGDLLKQYVNGISGIENKIDAADNLIRNLTNEKNSETQKICTEKERLHNLMKESNQDMQKLQEALFKLGKEN